MYSATDIAKLALALAFGAGAKAFDSELPACASEAPGQQISTDLLPLMSKAAKLKVGPLYAAGAPCRRGSQDPSNGQAGTAPWSWERSGQGWGQALGPLVLPHSSAEKLDEDMGPTHLVNQNQQWLGAPVVDLNILELRNHPRLDLNLAYGDLPSKLIFVTW